MAADDQDAPASPEGLPGWAGAGGALAYDAVTAPPPSGDDDDLGPDASDEERLAQIVARTRTEIGDEDVERVADVLHRRLTAAGLDVDADRTVALAAEITSR